MLSTSPQWVQPTSHPSFLLAPARGDLCLQGPFLFPSQFHKWACSDPRPPPDWACRVQPGHRKRSRILRLLLSSPHSVFCRVLVPCVSRRRALPWDLQFYKWSSLSRSWDARWPLSGLRFGREGLQGWHETNEPRWPKTGSQTSRFVHSEVDDAVDATVARVNFLLSIAASRSALR